MTTNAIADQLIKKSIYYLSLANKLQHAARVLRLSEMTPEERDKEFGVVRRGRKPKVAKR